RLRSFASADRRPRQVRGRTAASENHELAHPTHSRPSVSWRAVVRPSRQDHHEDRSTLRGARDPSAKFWLQGPATSSVDGFSYEQDNPVGSLRSHTNRRFHWVSRPPRKPGGWAVDQGLPSSATSPGRRGAHRPPSTLTLGADSVASPASHHPAGPADDLLLKVTAPRVPRHHVTRPRLQADNERFDKPVVLVQAPAGFGKT